MMAEKEIKFSDGSSINFILNDGALSFFIQARNLGKENKITSVTTYLTIEETMNLLSWIGEQLSLEDE